MNTPAVVLEAFLDGVWTRLEPRPFVVAVRYQRRCRVDGTTVLEETWLSRSSVTIRTDVGEYHFREYDLTTYTRELPSASSPECHSEKQRVRSAVAP